MNPQQEEESPSGRERGKSIVVDHAGDEVELRDEAGEGCRAESHTLPVGKNLPPQEKDKENRSQACCHREEAEHIDHPTPNAQLLVLQAQRSPQGSVYNKGTRQAGLPGRRGPFPGSPSP